MTQTIEAVYKVVPWSNTPGKEHAIVDLELYRKTTWTDDSVTMFGSNSINLTVIADKLNERIEKASEDAQAPAGVLTLDEETMRMLERVTEGMRGELENALTTHPLVNALRKAVEDSGSEVARQALAEAEEISRSRTQVTKETMVSKLIKRMYLDGVATGAVKP